MLRTLGPPPWHPQPSRRVHTQQWPLPPGTRPPALAPQRKHSRRPIPAAQTPYFRVCPTHPARGAGLAWTQRGEGQWPGRQASPCQVLEAAPPGRQTLVCPPGTGSHGARQGRARSPRGPRSHAEDSEGEPPPGAVASWLRSPQPGCSGSRFLSCLSGTCQEHSPRLEPRPLHPPRQLRGRHRRECESSAQELGGGGAGPAGTMARPGPQLTARLGHRCQAGHKGAVFPAGGRMFAQVCERERCSQGPGRGQLRAAGKGGPVPRPSTAYQPSRGPSPTRFPPRHPAPGILPALSVLSRHRTCLSPGRVPSPARRWAVPPNLPGGWVGGCHARARGGTGLQGGRQSLPSLGGLAHWKLPEKC